MAICCICATSKDLQIAFMYANYIFEDYYLLEKKPSYLRKILVISNSKFLFFPILLTLSYVSHTIGLCILMNL